MTRAPVLLAVLLCLALGVGACGSDAGDAQTKPQRLSDVLTASGSPTVESSPAKVESSTWIEASPSVAAPAPEIVRPRPFRASAAARHVRVLTSYGVRQAGSRAERRGALYIRDQLRAAGLEARLQPFSLPNGRRSQNVVAHLRGRSARTLVLGAHFDAKSPSPGANDNASGCAVLLELARTYAAADPVPSLTFVFFGSEEMIDADPNHHHFGSRHYVASLSRREKATVAGMISVDMVGVGDTFAVRTMGRGPTGMRRLVTRKAEGQGLDPRYLRDPGSSGWSDHEAFELAGIPAAWIEWREDPRYHTSNDKAAYVSSDLLSSTGTLLHELIWSMTARDLLRLRP